MYEDSWYNFVPDFQHRRGPSQGGGHRRKESLLQQNGTNDPVDAVEPLENLYEEQEDDNSPPEATLSRRVKSYSDLYNIVTAQIAKEARKKQRERRKRDNLEALAIETCPQETIGIELLAQEQFQTELLEASQQEYLLYHDQLAMTDRHLEALIRDTNGALDLLGSLSKSFRSVEDQTTSFRSQCEDLLTEQKRLQVLADEVGTDLHYYAYLDNVTRRLNAPGASRLVDDEAFGEILSNLDSCVAFMTKNLIYRDAESYLARYQALLTKALHLLEVGFTSRLERVSGEISKQIAATQSESTRHALAYGRFEEMLLESYSLIPNVQRVVLSAYDEFGNPKEGGNLDIYANTTKNIFLAYLNTRDRDMRPITQNDLDTFKTEVKEASVETAARNFIKQCYERSYSEANLFAKIFFVEPHFSVNPKSAFAALKPAQRSHVNGINIAPIATNLQSTLQPTDLDTICNVVGWVTNEYLLLDYDEDETPFTRHCRELTARLLAEHLWAFADAGFDAEITKSIAKAPVTSEHLNLQPEVSGTSSSSAYPPVRRALELLVMFDRAMPKERSQRNSPVIFRIVKETIAALQRAEARIKSTKNGTDPDLFMMKNLLIIKNELVSLEIGDVRANGPDGAGFGGAVGTMQHFGQIWDTLSPQGLMGLLSSLGNYIPLPAMPSVPTALWNLSSRGGTPTPNAAIGAPATRLNRANSGATTTGTISGVLGGGSVPESQDASELLDELLRQSIYAFTQRWATLLSEARGGLRGGPNNQQQLGGKNLVKIERDLEDMLDRAFSSQPEVVMKLKEAIQAQIDAMREKEKGGNRVTRV